MTHEEADIRKKIADASVELTARSPVVYLDFSPAERSFIVVQQDGTYSLIAFEGSELTLSVSAKLCPSSDGSEISIVGARSLSLGAATQSILKGRPDVVKNIPESSVILAAFGIRNVQGSRQYFYSTWSCSSGQLPKDNADALFEHNMSDILALSPDEHIQSSGVEFGPRAATLDIRCSDTFARFRLTGSIPNRLSSSGPSVLKHSNLLPLSSTELLVASPGSLKIIDAKYEAIHASLDLKKRKQSSSAGTNDTLDLLVYFSQIRQAIARKGTSLIAIGIRMPSEDGEKRVRKSRLVDSIGYGSQPLESRNIAPVLRPRFVQTTATNEHAYRRETDRYDQAFASGDAATFENFIITELSSDDYSSVREDFLVDYVLAKMFTLMGEESKATSWPEFALKANFVAPRLVEWLSQRGHLSVGRLQRALARQAGHKDLPRIKPVEIPQALFFADSSLELLRVHLTRDQSQNLEADVHAVKILIDLARHEAGLARLQHSTEILVETLVPVAEAEMDLNIYFMRRHLVESLVATVNRLGSYDQTHLSSSLRAAFAGADGLIGLIQFLRQQLYVGGNSSWMLSTPPEKERTGTTETGKSIALPESMSVVSFEAILKILCACMDAIGPLQLLATEKDNFLETIIPELLTEIELSAEYIEQSTGLQGILRETLRYSQSRGLEGMQQRDTAVDAGRHQPLGEIISIYSAHPQDEGIDGSSGVLPLSLKDEQIVDSRRVRKGGGQISIRSQRQQLMMEGRQRELYSFERLLL